MEILKGQQETKAAKIGIQGQSINVFNSPPGTRRKGTSERNVERIKTLEYAMNKMKRRGKENTPEFESLKLEHRRRLTHYEQDRWHEERET